jgi:catechol 2,3-dioxygenase-like lactoylglutathione lyase family enzyme
MAKAPQDVDGTGVQLPGCLARMGFASCHPRMYSIPTTIVRHPTERQTVQLVQVAQRVTDLDRAAAFYSDLLGSPPDAVFDPPGLVFFHLGPTRLLLDRAAPSALLYLEVGDVHSTVASLRRRGIEVTTDPHVIFEHIDDTLGPAGTSEWMAFIADSEDNTVGLVSRNPPAPTVPG